MHRRRGLAHQPLAKRGIGAVAGDAEHVVIELVGVIGPEICDRDLIFGKIGTERADILHPVIGEADRACGKAGIAAVLRRRRAFQHQNRSAVFRRCGRRLRAPRAIVHRRRAVS